MTSPSTGAAAAYGVLALPLAMAALPIYVHVPKFYGDQLGVPLAEVGAILLVVRAWDALQDPLLGAWSDRVRDRRGSRWGLITLGVAVLAAGMMALFLPPAALEHRAAWMAASLAVVYFGYSLAAVSYQALGAEISTAPAERTRLAAWREGFGLAGVLLASMLPELLGRAYGPREGFALLAAGFVPCALACTAWSARHAPAAQQVASARTVEFANPLRNPAFRRLAAVFLLNGIAAAIPATLVLFFVEDVLGAAPWSGAFLATYFASGAIGLPAWVALARRFGRERAWRASMALALAAFGGAFLLGAGDTAAFLVVCVLSGLALGADLALPASLLADAIDRDERGAGRAAGTYFGAWTLLSKASLALAAGVALPLVTVAGYVPHAVDAHGVQALSATYALLPCVLKAGALLMLTFWRS